METVRGHVGQRIMRLAHSFYSIIIDFVYPPFCLVCQNRLDPGQKFVCDGCWHSFQSLDQPFLPMENLDILQHTRKYFDHSIALYEYSKVIQDLIHVMKYKSRPGIASKFGKDVGHFSCEQKLLMDIDAIVPVPLHPLRYRERGYNQAGLLAHEIGRQNNIAVYEKILKRTRYTNQQATFNKAERVENVRDAFRVKSGKDIQNKNIALVDDVLTTGSTMNECAKVLKNAGAHDIIAVTIVRI